MLEKHLVKGKDILLCFDLGSSKASTEVKKQLGKYEKLRNEDTEVLMGSFLLLPTQESMEKRMGMAGSKKKKKISALCNVIGKETLHFCVFGSLDARPLLYLTTPAGTDTGVFNKMVFLFLFLYKYMLPSGPKPTAHVTGCLCPCLTPRGALGPRCPSLSRWRPCTAELS